MSTPIFFSRENKPYESPCLFVYFCLNRKKTFTQVETPPTAEKAKPAAARATGRKAEPAKRNSPALTKATVEMKPKPAAKTPKSSASTKTPKIDPTQQPATKTPKNDSPKTKVATKTPRTMASTKTPKIDPPQLATKTPKNDSPKAKVATKTPKTKASTKTPKIAPPQSATKTPKAELGAQLPKVSPIVRLAKLSPALQLRTPPSSSPIASRVVRSARRRTPARTTSQVGCARTFS
jgi:hypothetical protein